MASYQVKNSAGDIQSVDEDKLALAAKDGYFPIVVHNNGDTQTVPLNKLHQAVAEGYVPQTQESPNRSLVDKGIGMVRGAGEAGLNLATGAASGLAADIGTMVANRNRNLGKAVGSNLLQGGTDSDKSLEQQANDLREKYTYQPRSEEGQQYSENVSNLLSPVGNAVKWAGNKVSDALSASPDDRSAINAAMGQSLGLVPLGAGKALTGVRNATGNAVDSFLANRGAGIAANIVKKQPEIIPSKTYPNTMEGQIEQWLTPESAKLSNEEISNLFKSTRSNPTLMASMRNDVSPSETGTVNDVRRSLKNYTDENMPGPVGSAWDAVKEAGSKKNIANTSWQTLASAFLGNSIGGPVAAAVGSVAPTALRAGAAGIPNAIDKAAINKFLSPSRENIPNTAMDQVGNGGLAAQSIVSDVAPNTDQQQELSAKERTRRLVDFYKNKFGSDE